MLRAGAAEIEQYKNTHTRVEFEAWLEEQEQQQSGRGEVYAIVELTLDQILEINEKGFLDLQHQFADGVQTIQSKPTADALAPILRDARVVDTLRKLTGNRLMILDDLLPNQRIPGIDDLLSKAESAVRVLGVGTCRGGPRHPSAAGGVSGRGSGQRFRRVSYTR